jgi:hypothetical protein
MGPPALRDARLYAESVKYGWFPCVTTAVLAVALAACSQSSLCDGTSADVTVLVDAGALATPGSHIRVCVEGFCNPDDSDLAKVSVNYDSAHPRAVTYEVTRITNGTAYEGYPGGEVRLGCPEVSTSFSVSVAVDGTATIAQTP